MMNKVKLNSMRIILLVFIGVVYFAPLKGQENYMQAIDSGDTRSKRGHYEEAINFYFAAEAFNPLKKEDVKGKINGVFKKIDSVKNDALSQRKRADSATRKAKDEEGNAKRERDRVDSARQQFYLFNLANAPYKYVRLIRDAPKDKEKIREYRFDTNLVAYSIHLDILRDSLKKYEKKMPEEKKGYDHLRENLYFNNELYEKIFYCLDANGRADLILKNSPDSPAPDYFNVQSLGDHNDSFRLSQDSGTIYRHVSNKVIDSIKLSGQKFTSFTLSENRMRLFCATDDNYIVAYSILDSKPHSLPDTIAMGTTVTALDFDDSTNILFFGTKSGDIGFIEFDGDGKKYQPIYSTENFMAGSKITAIDYFYRGARTFLLAAGLDGRAAVYKIDSNLVVPGKKFSGNHLPDPRNDLGNFLHARFDEREGAILLETSGGNASKFYIWDPFTDSVLEKFKSVIGTVPPDIMIETNYYYKPK